MSRFHGAYGSPGQKATVGKTERNTKTNGNKGVLRAYMAQKRLEAERRNALTPEHRKRISARKMGYVRLSDVPETEPPTE